MHFQLLICLATLLGTISAQNYHYDMLSGRTRGIIASLFGGTGGAGGAGGGLFPFFGPKPDLAALINPNTVLTLNTRLRTVERNLATQTRLNTVQAAQITALQAAAAALPAAGAAEDPTCPVLAVNAEYIADLGRCYSVEVAGLPFLDAQTDCQEKGGRLAEFAVANRANFMTALNGNAALMTAIAGLAAPSILFIGLQTTVADAGAGQSIFTFLSGAPTVDSTSAIIFNANPIDSPALRQAVAIEAPTGALLRRVDALAPNVATLVTGPLPYICDFDPIP